MTRSYTEGAITGSATPTDDLFALIETELTAHPAWTKVDTDFVDGSYTFQVWKCDGVINGVGTFHVIFGSTGSATTPYFMLAEDYDAVNHLCRRPAPFGYSTSSQLPDPSDWSFDPTTWITPKITDYRLKYMNCIVDTVDMNYQISVEDSYLYVGTKTGPASVAAVYVGLFEDLMPSPNFLPAVILQLNNTTVSGSNIRFSAPGSFTRFPYQTANLSDYYIWKALNPFHSDPGSWTQVNDIIGNGDLFLQGAPWGSRCMVSAAGQQGSGTNSDTYGGIRGLLPEHFMYINSGATIEFGDTITMNSQIYAHVNLHGWVSKEVIA